MINPVSSEILRKINECEITGSSSATDLKNALTLSVAAYRDYWHYQNVLWQLDENFDESLEEYDPDTWFFRGTEKADILAMECVESLQIASTNFGRIKERAKENLELVIKAVLSAPLTVQKSVLGKAYEIKADETDTKLEELFDILDETEYKHAIPDNLDIFLKIMDEVFTSAIS